jgi:hypothetical protein
VRTGPSDRPRRQRVDRAFEPAVAHHAGTTALLKAHLLEPFAASVITLAEVYAGAAFRLGELHATTKLKMPDCCVLYTAEQHSAGIATLDDGLAARASDLGLSIATNRPYG